MSIEKESKEIKGIKGGKRAGAGRKPNTPNKRTAEIQQAVEQSGLTPLEYMLHVMRNEGFETRDRMTAAVAAAPYVHAKLSSVELAGTGPGGSILLDQEIIIKLVEPSGS